MAEPRPRIVIVGGGFGGLAAAKALDRAPAEVIVIDRNDHHVFQPLLYQVATAVLTPSQIGSSIRSVVGRQKNTTVLKCNVTGIDTAQRRIFVDSIDREAVPIEYDFLVLATGVRHSYFAHPEFEPFAPGLKSLSDAVLIRNRILEAFEQAETEADPSKHQDLLTFVLVGAGPTGVEMAGAIAILVRSRLREEYRRIDPTKARIVLVDMMPKVLGTFAEGLSGAATARLERIGVEVRLGHGVDLIDADGVVVAGERIASKTVIWTAGVAPSPAGKWLATKTDRAGRVRVEGNLSVASHPEVFVVGDTASLDQDGKPLPGVAQVAMQQGRYVGKLLHRRLNGQADPPAFRYFDKGNMAVVGKGFAVLQSGGIKLSGFIPWLAWAAVHLQFLAQSYLRVSVFLQWVWTYLTGKRGSRLIISPPAMSLPPMRLPSETGNLPPRTLPQPQPQLSRT
jgi:NADH:ubiquinone reductase (H+-translocating)